MYRTSSQSDHRPSYDSGQQNMSNNAQFQNPAAYNNSAMKPGRGGQPPQKSSNPEGKYTNEQITLFLFGSEYACRHIHIVVY
jgi:hypothetical protein